MLPQVAEAVPKDADGKAFEFYATFSGNLNPKLDRIRNVGPMDRPLWLEEVAKSKFMVGYWMSAADCRRDPELTWIAVGRRQTLSLAFSYVSFHEVWVCTDTHLC